KYIEKNDVGKSLFNFSRGDPGDEIREISENISKELNTFSNLTKTLSEKLTDIMDDLHFPIPRLDLEQLFQQIGSWQGRAESIKQLWQSYSQSSHHDLETEDNDMAIQHERSPSARWLSIEESNLGNIDICLSSSPTDAGGILQMNLWKHCYSAILTSATIRTLGSFNNFKKNVGLPGNSECKAVEGAFNFFNAGSLLIPDIGVDAGDSTAHTVALIKKLPQLIDSNEGTLVLFSSRRQMDQVFDGLSGDFKKKILTQGLFTHHEIVCRHKQAIDENNGSIIFGLASFAEGMDFPGDYCRHVIIAKIPFSVPDDPIYRTLSEWIEEQGGNPFMELMLPEASIRLHQACGRLIRSEADTGRVTILDRRILTKRYGEKLLADLPPFSRKF
ncbi:MAG: ATP-dependent DNA helicase DinG, partial [Cellvibrionales bacterium]|nr:ATP-dependent DNA helicase DinG [Cellvibrionales bacterium]